MRYKRQPFERVYCVTSSIVPRQGRSSDSQPSQLEALRMPRLWGVCNRVLATPHVLDIR